MKNRKPLGKKVLNVILGCVFLMSIGMVANAGTTTTTRIKVQHRDYPATTFHWHTATSITSEGTCGTNCTKYVGHGIPCTWIQGVNFQVRTPEGYSWKYAVYRVDGYESYHWDTTSDVYTGGNHYYTYEEQGAFMDDDIRSMAELGFTNHHARISYIYNGGSTTYSREMHCYSSLV